jgi:CheY-like chemotaxis protein
MKEAGAWDRIVPLLRQLLGIDAGEPSAAPPRSRPSRGALEASVEETRPTLLLIDDDLRILKALKARLTSRGFHVLRAASGTQGYWMSLKDRPNAIITDYHMPEGRGDHLIPRLKQHPLTKDVPVIVVTGRKVPERRFLNLGAARVLSKPLNLEALLSELSRWFPLPSRKPETQFERVAATVHPDAR